MKSQIYVSCVLHNWGNYCIYVAFYLMEITNDLVQLECEITYEGRNTHKRLLLHTYLVLKTLI